MNNLSFICGTLLIGIISANANPVHSQDPSDNNPSLSCVLFKELGCDVQCTFMAKLQNSPQTLASCNDEQKCTCTAEPESLDTLWNKKFDADDVLRQIKVNRKLSGKVTQVLQNASRTAEQSKQDLEKILPKRLLSKILVKQYNTSTAEPESLDDLWNKKFDADDVLRQIKVNRKLAQKVTQVLKNASRTAEQSKQDLEEILPKRLLNKIWVVKQYDTTTTEADVESIEKLVNKELSSVLSNSPEFDSTNLKCLHWVHNFFVYLNDHKQSASIQSIYHQVDLTGNELLKEKLGFFLKKNDAPKIDTTIKYEQDNTVSQIVANMVVDGMIKELGIPKCFVRS